MIILYSFQAVLQLIQLVVMRGEQRFGLVGMLMDILYDAPGNRDTVIGAGSPAYLIQYNEAAAADIIDNARGFVHFHHKGRFSPAQVIGGAHAREYLICKSYGGRPGGDVGAGVRQQRDQRGLPQQRGFTGHIRTGKYDDLLLCIIQPDVIGDILLAGRKLLLYDWMPALPDVQHLFRADLRPAVIMELGGPGK